MTSYFQDDDREICLSLAVAYAPASTSCLLACRVCVMSLAHTVCYSSWSIIHSYLLDIWLHYCVFLI